MNNRKTQLRVAAVLVFVVVLGGGSMQFATAVSSSAEETNSFLASSASSKMLTADGDLLANLHGEIDRDPVALKEIPKHLQRAAIAIEDRRFYDHGGIDIRGIARAFLTNIRNNDRQGGSTITQQLAKNLYFHGEPRTVWRKATEAVLTLGLERKADKDGILEAYLNTAYFGRGVYGVQAASRSYFHRDVQKLTLAQSAFLAGLIHAPSRYDFSVTDTPGEQERRKDAAIARRDRVLDAMVDVGSITKEAARSAVAEELKLHQPRDPRWTHPYFVDAVLRELGVLRNRGQADPDPRFAFLGSDHTERANAVYRNGLRITTTLDRGVQEDAEKAIATQLPDGTLPKVSSAVVTVEPGTGFVRALVGGRNYYPKGCEDTEVEAKPNCRNAKVNLALGALAGGSGRQPGSSFKPIVLAAALEEDLSLRQTLNGSPFAYKYDTDTWKVSNYEGSAGGTMSVVDATVKSVNAAFARLEIQFLGDGDGLKGAAKVAATARKLGIAFPTEEALRAICKESYGKNGGCTPADAVPAIALGAKEVSPLEMAGAYATFANDGVYARPTLVEKITDAKGKVLYEAEPKTHRAVSRETALGVSHVLQQAVQRGTGRAAQLADRPVAGKTGTSQAWRDAWFAGYIPQLATVAWVGNPRPVQSSDGSWSIESMVPSNGYGVRVTGGSYPARIWNALMTPATKGMKVEGFEPAPRSLFGPPKHLKGSSATDDLIGSGIADTMRLRRSGRNVVVHRECPPDGGPSRGMQVWKQEERGGETHVWRSRAVCR